MSITRGIALVLSIAFAASCRVRETRTDEPVVDTTKPEKPTFQEPVETGPREQYTNRKFVEFPITPEKTSGRKGVELWYSLDAVTWTNHGFYATGTESARFMAPRDGKYRVLLVPVDMKDQREFTPKQGDKPEFVVVIDTTKPVVEVLAPNGGEVFGAGHSTVVLWTALDETLSPTGIKIQASTGGDSWATIVRDLPNSGRYHWDIPRSSSETYRLRVVAADLAGNEGWDDSDHPFIVDGLAPDVRITGPTLAGERPVKVEYLATDLGGAGLQKVSLHVSRDGGQTWQFHHDDEDVESPVRLEELDGVLGLYLVGVDKMGNATQRPVAGSKPMATVTLDTTKPAVKILSPVAGAYLGGRAVDILWSARDNLGMAANGITLSYSEDDGRTWIEIVKDLKDDGVYKWTVPAKGDDRYRVKVAARDLVGNVAEAVSERFAVDADLPEAVAVGPTRANSNTVKVEYEIKRPGFGKIAKITLWYTPDGGRQWFKVDDDPDLKSPVVFSKTDGKYGLTVTCVSEAGERAGLSQAPPPPGAKPQLEIEIDASPPELTLESFTKEGYVRAGVVRDIRWSLKEAHPDPAGLTIVYTPDGGMTWVVIASKQDPTTGKHTWEIPKERGREHRVRLECTDTFGNKGVVESERAFTLDDDEPMILIEPKPPKSVKGRACTAGYRAEDRTSGIARVELWGKPLDLRAKYRKLAESVNPQGEITGTVAEDGMWGFILVAVDGVDRRSVDPATEPKPDFIVALDTTPPTVQIKRYRLDNRWLYINNKYEIEWTASDRITVQDALTVRIDVSSDAGKTWTALASKELNADRFDVRSALVRGKRYHIRVTVFDEAGNQASDETPEFSVDDLPQPTLGFRSSFLGGQPLLAGNPITLYWDTSDSAIKEVVLEMQKGGSADWINLGRFSSKAIRFTVPKDYGPYTLRVTATDGLNQKISSGYLTFVSSKIVPVDIKIIAKQEVNAGGLQSVAILPKGLHKQVKKAVVQLFDGRDWTDVVELKSDSATFTAPSKLGDYAVRVLAEDTEGNKYASNEYVFTVRTPKEPPKGDIILQNFNDKEIYRGKSALVIAIKTSLPLDQFRVAYSAQGGKEGTWVEVPQNQLVPVSGGILWKSLPETTGRAYRLRLTTDTGVQVVSARDWSIDSTAPSTSVTGPKGPVATLPVKLQYRDVPSIAAITSRTLFVSKDDGATWKPYLTFDTADVMFSAKEEGTYGFYLTAKARDVSLESEAPSPGTRPQHSFEFKTDRGSVKLTSKMEGTYKGNDKGKNKVKVTWLGSSPDPKATVSLHLFADGKESLIAKGLKVSGEFEWEVPKLDVEKAEIRISLDAATGSTPGTPSGSFKLDSTPPKVTGVEVELPK